MAAKIDHRINVPGPYFFKISGSIYHYTNKCLQPKDDQNYSYNQLYILDTKDATEFRMQHETNKNCLKSVKNSLVSV